MTIPVPGQRILALDYGTVRIGAAVSDPLRLIASAIGTYPNDARFPEVLGGIISEYVVGMVVVGMPRTLKGTDSRKTEEVHDFIAKLRTWIPVPITTWDERLSSVEAKRTMIEVGLGRKKRREKARVDQIAAAIVLQGFLDARGYERREDH